MELQSLRSSLLLCTADGVALGAAATTDQAGVEMIVFIAIMLHKVP
jgi:zinc transporter 9